MPAIYDPHEHYQEILFCGEVHRPLAPITLRVRKFRGKPRRQTYSNSIHRSPTGQSQGNYGPDAAVNGNPPWTTVVKMSGNHIDVIIDNQPVRALVDTGAAVSIISDAYRRQLRKTRLENTHLVLTVADGNSVQTTGSCTIRLCINGRKQPFKFVVIPKCSENVILGLDFLEASRAFIDCGRSKLHLHEASSSIVNDQYLDCITGGESE